MYLYKYIYSFLFVYMFICAFPILHLLVACSNETHSILQEMQTGCRRASIRANDFAVEATMQILLTAAVFSRLSPQFCRGSIQGHFARFISTSFQTQMFSNARRTADELSCYSRGRLRCAYI